MKRIIILIAVIGMCQIAVLSQKKYDMILEKTDGTVVVIKTDDILRTYFKERNNGLPEGAEAIDLGLPSGTKWANMNVGASKPEEYGCYFAYGEVEEKSIYSTENYNDNDLYRDDTWHTAISISYTKYDAAHVCWGGSWHMPTGDQCSELLFYCNTEWTTINGIYGYKLTSKLNGNSIFLPANGRREFNSISYVGARGYYWGSNYTIRFLENTIGYYCTNKDEHYLGYSIRPVTY